MPAVTNCTHATRYVARDGRTLCEECARVAAGWVECRAWGCVVMVPPDMKRCDTHRVSDDECDTCNGEGVVDCEEFDCHGPGWWVRRSGGSPTCEVA